MCVVVEDAQLKVIRSSNKPIFPSDKLDAPNWNFRHFKRFDDSTRVMIVDVDGAIVETCNQPWLSRMEVDALDAIRPRKELFLGNYSISELNLQEQSLH